MRKPKAKKLRTDAEVAAIVARIAALLRAGHSHQYATDKCKVKLFEVRAISTLYGGIHYNTVVRTVTAIAAMVAEGCPFEDIAESLGFSIGYVRALALRHSIKAPTRSVKRAAT